MTPSDSTLDQVRSVWRLLETTDRRRCSILIVGGVFLALLELLTIALLYPLIQSLQSDSSLDRSSRIVKIVGADTSNQFVQRLALLLGILFTIKTTLSVFFSKRTSVWLSQAEARMRRRVLAAYLRNPWLELRKMPISELSTACFTHTTAVFDNTVLPFLMLSSDAVSILAMCAPLIYLYPAITGALFLYLFVLVILYSRVILRRVGALSATLYSQERRSRIYLYGVAGAMKEIVLAGRKRDALDTFGGHAATYSELAGVQRFAHSLPRYFFEYAITTGFLFLIGLFTIFSGNSPIAAIGLFGAVAFRMTPSLTRLLSLATMIRSGRSAAKHVSDVLADESRQSLDDQDAAPVEFQTMEFDSVSFSYGEEPVFSGIDFTIERGDWIGIRGASGSGKSTFVDVALGLLEPTAGRILLNGELLSGRQRKSWQRSIGYVPQDVSMIDGTVRENVLLGTGRGGRSDEEIWMALEKAELADTVRSLDGGLDCLLGENRAFSGGQRQRLGVTRALLGNPSVLVMDEANSGLDQQTEDAIMNTIQSLEHRPTILMISHRPESFRFCSKTLELRR